MEQPISLNVTQAAKHVGLSRYTIYEAIKSGALIYWEPYPGADKRINVSELNAWIARSSVRSTSAA